MRLVLDKPRLPPLTVRQHLYLLRFTQVSRFFICDLFHVALMLFSCLPISVQHSELSYGVYSTKVRLQQIRAYKMVYESLQEGY